MTKQIKRIDTAQFNSPEAPAGNTTADTDTLKCSENTYLQQLATDRGIGPAAPLPNIEQAISKIRAEYEVKARALSDAEATIRYLTRALVGSQEREEKLRKILGERQQVADEVRRGYEVGSCCNRNGCHGIITLRYGLRNCPVCGWELCDEQ